MSGRFLSWTVLRPESGDMATAELHGSVVGEKRKQPRGESHDNAAAAEQVLTVSLIVGAVAGAIAGTALWAAMGAGDPRGAGIIGTMVGGVLAAFVGRYVLIPVWTSLFGDRET